MQLAIIKSWQFAKIKFNKQIKYKKIDIRRDCAQNE